MAGVRRSHALGLAVAIILLYLLFFSGDSTDFRKTTEESLSARRGVLRGSLSDADLTAQTNQELQSILDKQKDPFDATPVQDPAQKSGPDAVSDASSDEESSVAGRISVPRPKEKPKYPMESAAAGGSGKKDTTSKPETTVDEGEEMARQEFHDILKKSPIIIFSKSYCPYSKRAKALLLETYTISPAPYVVELDQMTKPVPKPHNDDNDEAAPAPTLGRKLQDLLITLTGRRTVPNIMINAQSLGGSDDLAHMDAEGTLEEQIKKMGGKRIVSIEKKSHNNKV
ncbi:hypothetical protein PV11_07519 [Exophiala sideris]|uniref:Uncharacterized protein n=1 Tax=Exophiala sideris TaxID=1016849 RepID=A0A0D1YZ02_9EURO|nr:hypothetical protein PV11_07519 [Exophiala sideris]